MDSLTLFQEYRLIERNDSEINGAWKGMHLLLFFLAFVFGSFCTFCFHMLMYLFDEKCVLFPKLLSLTSLRHNVIYEFIPEDKDKFDMLPVDFLSTQWMEKSACYLPTYVPLVSGIFGLVWTTMFLMCSTGGRTLTGLQRSWRVLPPVFAFSLAMGGLCIYSSVMTHYGLQELCVKLGEITGSSTCSYTVNVATLAYERQIRGVYQATRLTILSAWLHTSCWVLSALLALLRVLLAIDFQLVRVSVDLVGNIDTMLERHERHIRTVSPNTWQNNEMPLVQSSSYSDSKIQKKTDYETELAEDFASLHTNESDLLFFALPANETSELSLVPQELQKLSRLKAYQSVPKEHHFIVKIVYDLVENLELPYSPIISSPSVTPSTLDLESDTKVVARQFGQEDIAMTAKHRDSPDITEAQNVAREIKRMLNERLNNRLVELPLQSAGTSHGIPSTSKRSGYIAFEESTLNLTDELRKTLQDTLNKSLNDLEQQRKKSNLKHKSSQTYQDKKKEPKSKRVKLSDSVESENKSSDESSSDSPKNKETQTKPKEKQD